MTASRERGSSSRVVPSDRGPLHAYGEVTPTDAYPCLGSLRVVDVREPWEFKGPLGHVEGSEVLPLCDFLDQGGRWGKEESLLFVCRSGRRSGNACQSLVKHGHPPEKVLNLSGGMIAWNQARLPLTRAVPENEKEMISHVIRWAAQGRGVSFREEAARWGGMKIIEEGALGRGTRSQLTDLVEAIDDSFDPPGPPDRMVVKGVFSDWIAQIGWR